MAAKAEYHLSRSELLGWLNNLLGLSYTKVEQCASGKIAHEPTFIYSGSCDSPLLPNATPCNPCRCRALPDHGFSVPWYDTGHCARILFPWRPSLMPSLRAGKVPMSKVNFAAKQDYEFVNNYKILQKVFDRCNVDKVPTLTRVTHTCLGTLRSVCVLIAGTHHVRSRSRWRSCAKPNIRTTSNSCSG